jgi:hypothetical protein
MVTIKQRTKPRIPSPAFILTAMDDKAETPEWGSDVNNPPLLDSRKRQTNAKHNKTNLEKRKVVVYIKHISKDIQNESTKNRKVEVNGNPIVEMMAELQAESPKTKLLIPKSGVVDKF